MSSTITSLQGRLKAAKTELAKEADGCEAKVLQLPERLLKEINAIVKEAAELPNDPPADILCEVLRAKCKWSLRSGAYSLCLSAAEHLHSSAAGRLPYVGYAKLWQGRGLIALKKRSEGRAAYRVGIAALSEWKSDSNVKEEVKGLISRLKQALKRSRSRSKSGSPRRRTVEGVCEGKEEKGEVEAVAAVGAEGKFPSIPHLDFSPQVHSDDIQLGKEAANWFVGVPVVVTEKMDGGNCCLSNGYTFARTHKQQARHPSFSPIKALHASIRGMLEDNVAYFGENMVAVHSITYTQLRAYFYLFGIREARGVWRSWDAVEHTADMLGLEHAHVVFKGTFKNSSEIKSLMDSLAKKKSSVCPVNTPEGFVIRLARSFTDNEFKEGKALAKYVRKGHCQTDRKWGSHWTKAKIYYGPKENEEKTTNNEKEHKIDESRSTINSYAKTHKKKGGV